MIKLITAIFLALGIITSESFAGVRSIVSDSSSSDVAVSGNSNGNDYTYEEPSYDLDPAVQCQNSGFARRGCPAGYRPIGECPICSLSLKLKREMQSINCSIRKKAACYRQKM